MKNLCGCGCGSEVERRFLSGHQARVRDMKRENNGYWKGGEYLNWSGYVMKNIAEDHPRTQSNGYVREHILIAEKALGKPLPERSQTHHYGERSDNTKIVICEDQEYHYLLHMRSDALTKSGNPNYRKCKFCKTYDAPENLHITHCPPYGWNIHHQSCESAYEKIRTIKRREKRNAIKKISI